MCQSNVWNVSQICFAGQISAKKKVSYQSSINNTHSKLLKGN